MRTKLTSTFLKQMAALPADVRDRVESFAFDGLPHAQALTELGQVKKLRGYKHCYRARFGDYRVGIQIENGVAHLKVVMHRSQIYRRFPK